MGSYPIETSLCEAITDDNKTSGMVQIENIWHYPNNDLYVILSEAKWKNIFGYQYRSDEPMKTLEKFKMVREQAHQLESLLGF